MPDKRPSHLHMMAMDATPVDGMRLNRSGRRRNGAYLPIETQRPTRGNVAGEYFNPLFTVRHCHHRRSLSGVASCSPPITLTDDGANQTVTGTAVDRAGNSTSITVTVSIDRTSPLIAATRTAANSAGWNNGDVTVTFTCTDALSGVMACPDPVTKTAEGANQSAAGTAADHAGNTAAAAVTNINIDKTPPTITATMVDSPNPAGWYHTAPTVSLHLCRHAFRYR
jgi:hypothetical protein